MEDLKILAGVGEKVGAVEIRPVPRVCSQYWRARLMAGVNAQLAGAALEALIVRPGDGKEEGDLRSEACRGRETATEPGETGTESQEKNIPPTPLQRGTKSALGFGEGMDLNWDAVKDLAGKVLVGIPDEVARLVALWVALQSLNRETLLLGFPGEALEPAIAEAELRVDIDMTEGDVQAAFMLCLRHAFPLDKMGGMIGAVRQVSRMVTEISSAGS